VFLHHSDEKNVVLAVVSAAEDTALSIGVKEAQKYDRSDSRSMGVMTKIDITKDYGPSCRGSCARFLASGFLA
jgi:hypothetical protein